MTRILRICSARSELLACIDGNVKDHWSKFNESYYKYNELAFREWDFVTVMLSKVDYATLVTHLRVFMQSIWPVLKARQTTWGYAATLEKLVHSGAFTGEEQISSFHDNVPLRVAREWFALSTTNPDQIWIDYASFVKRFQPDVYEQYVHLNCLNSIFPYTGPNGNKVVYDFGVGRDFGKGRRGDL